ncbi:cold shock domain-containing protein [Pseudocolwellia sp. AS88]|uniref:cold shock domain-containing protein n=1 Tax=Pseudocolwellia sp. AS88 TaxID=3063958 RepID=UPI0026EFE91C|nr:cold shock domain-containing protein [Pseudocolwellia sp. AS88]MDO7085667.1 cold shock domain-containing protein [Pseudocolwellia sp. AS88]
MYRGQLTKWDNAKGFGFIKSPDLSNDTFIHISELSHMSRKPKQGDYIHFNIEQHQGKTRAINARIEGAKSISTLQVSKHSKPKSSNKLIYGLIFVGFTAFIVQRLDLGKTNQIPQTQLIEESSISKPLTKTPTQSFTCDGRQHCSQMRSRAEAEYFIQHCPNTKMDGDRDGIPCERQF